MLINNRERKNKGIILFFFILITSLTHNIKSQSQLILHNNNTTKASTYIKDKNSNKADNLIKLTGSRILLKTILNSLCKITEIKQAQSNINPIFYKFGKIASTVIVEEIIPNNSNNKIKKISEALVPIILEEIIIREYKNYNINIVKNSVMRDEETKLELLKRISIKIFSKLIRSNFFLGKENKYYNYVKYFLAYPIAFTNPKTINFDINTGIKNILHETLKSTIQSQKTNLGVFLNKKHRKRAIAQTLSVILESFINEVTNNRKNNAKSESFEKELA